MMVVTETAGKKCSTIFNPFQENSEQKDHTRDHIIRKGTHDFS